MATTTGAKRSPKSKLKIERVFTTEGVHPYDTVEWERTDIVQTNWRDGSVNFEQKDVEFPTSWSANARNIVTTKYFRGNVGKPGREASLREVIDRVVMTYGKAGFDAAYFDAAGRDVFEAELTHMLLNQYFAFNSPVWFNVGAKGRSQQISACFILSVDDSMQSILNWYTEEGMIFKGGSGAGLNISAIRGSKELLASGGTASGPISFMRGADASAGAIKSGGGTRRAAKMVVLDVDHPDVSEFVMLKAREENKIRALREAGFDMDLGGEDILSVQFQNANNSVRVTDEFMQAVVEKKPFNLLNRNDGAVAETVDAVELFNRINEAAWACADPGLQYDTTINDWHTCAESGRINASNPCSEYMHLDNTSCNLASLNLMKFLKPDGRFDADLFVKAVELIITAMDISIVFGDFPTDSIRDNTRKYRQLGIGFANLGALLMATGHGYDSPGGRALAGAITSLMTGTSYRRSAELAGVVGAYDGYAQNEAPHKRVMRKHHAAATALKENLEGRPNVTFVEAGIVESLPVSDAHDVAVVAEAQWAAGNKIGEKNGWRNSQASVLAPTGTIGFMMDCDTTGIEPDFSLVKYKKLVGGASMQIVNQTVGLALKSLGYQPETVEAIVEYIAENGHVVDAPGLKPEHYEVFDTAMGRRSISAMGHVRMMAACQPFLSGAISKTVNLPESATVEEIAEVHLRGWQLGLKAIAVYRDNCKVGQPLSDAKAEKVEEAVEAAVDAVSDELTALRAEVAALNAKLGVGRKPQRARLPKYRPGIIERFSVAGADGYLISGQYPKGYDGNEDIELGEVFMKLGKQGSTLAGIMDAFSIAISIALQHGVPLKAFVEKFVGMRFEPAGMTDDPEIRIATSVMDYIFRRLALDYLELEDRADLHIYSTEERTRYQETGSYTLDAEDAALANLQDFGPETIVEVVEPEPVEPKRLNTPAELSEAIVTVDPNAPLCTTCGIHMRRAGSCHVCESCGTTSGCS